MLIKTRLEDRFVLRLVGCTVFTALSVQTLCRGVIVRLSGHIDGKNILLVNSNFRAAPHLRRGVTTPPAESAFVIGRSNLRPLKYRETRLSGQSRLP